MDKRLTALALLGLVSPLLAAGPEPTLPAPVALRDSWVRALPPTQTSTAAYLTLSNQGENPVKVVAARASVADRVEIHTTREVGGLMRMEQLQELELSPGASVELAPGGTHLMLLGLERMPAVGETIRLCVQLEPGGELCTDAPVRKSSAVEGGHHHHHHKE